VVFDLITNPVITHVNSFGALQIKCIVSDTHRTEIVTKDFSLSLWVSQIRQSVNNTDSGLTNYEGCGILGCCGRRDDGFDDYAQEAYWGVGNLVVSAVTQEQYPAGPRSSF